MLHSCDTFVCAHVLNHVTSSESSIRQSRETTCDALFQHPHHAQDPSMTAAESAGSQDEMVMHQNSTSSYYTLSESHMC